MKINKTSRKITLAIVLPAYNEQAVIGSVIDDLLRSRLFHKPGLKTRLIVIDDASTDSTAKLSMKSTGVTLISHLINSGAGAATRTGLHYARDLGSDYALTMDADGQHSVKDAERLANAIMRGEADMIIGSRLISRVGNMPLQKRLGNFGLGLITYLLLGVYASDTQSGLKAFNKKALATIEYRSNDYAFCSEMIWKARQSKLIIKEIPIQAIYTKYSVSRGQRSYSGAINIVKELIKRRMLDLIHG